MEEKIVKEIEITTFSHATEDREKVLQALLNLLPSVIREKASKKVSVNILQGHYNNPITILKLVIRGSEAQQIFRHIIASLDESDVIHLMSSIDIRYDGKGNFYFRVNKQDAFLGDIIVDEQSDDIIKIKVVFYPHIREHSQIKEYISRFKCMK